jgi:hypothetical protein
MLRGSMDLKKKVPTAGTAFAVAAMSRELYTPR